MQTIIDQSPELENLRQLIYKDNPTEQDLVSLKKLIAKYPDIKIDVCEEQSYLTPIGYAIDKGKPDIVSKLIEAGEKLSEVKALVYPDGGYETAFGYAIRHDKLYDKLLSLFQGQLEAGEKLSEVKALVYPDEGY